ncbi:MAG: hypothetical protein GF411_00900 [Candidatus Lokiarchaeota archaeon]|nr:hypothetical protein [Candidatus Lokiarchaeota archaeon]
MSMVKTIELKKSWGGNYRSSDNVFYLCARKLQEIMQIPVDEAESISVSIYDEYPGFPVRELVHTKYNPDGDNEFEYNGMVIRLTAAWGALSYWFGLVQKPIYVGIEYHAKSSEENRG